MGEKLKKTLFFLAVGMLFIFLMKGVLAFILLLKTAENFLLFLIILACLIIMHALLFP